jgi:purine-cytosine permease-like protein
MEGRPISNLVNLGAWITGILVSLAVGFGMIQGVLTVPYVQAVVPIAGWVVIILTIVSVILAIANRF